ncbi:MAG: hypothetical protein G01um10147_283 [Microgenomates group bacterium Gr01-1014_7]|nr:MAG: hypothetical protein G01um10147_283 [Microgenomates group bacterium Gr01-1014_7]
MADPNSPEFSETPTADAAEEFLRNVREIHAIQRANNTIDPEAARTQCKEFAQLTEEIMQQVQSLPPDDYPFDTKIPGIQVIELGTQRAIGINTKEATIPFNPLLIRDLVIIGIPSRDLPYYSEWVVPKYVIQVEHRTEPGMIPPFRSTPIEGDPQSYLAG